MEQKAPFTEKRFIVTFIFVTSLFLMWGVLHAMSDVLNKHFQDVLNLSKSKSGLIQFSVFGAYFVMSIPAGAFLKRFGYKPGVILGLTLFAGGLFLFVPAANAASFNFFRIALFIMGCGMATLETVAHPFAAALGDQRTSDQRINFAQTFNAIGTIIGPGIGTYFLLRATGGESGDLSSVKTLYTGIACVLVVIAIAFLFLKIPRLALTHAEAEEPGAANVDTEPAKPLFSHKHFVWAVVAQFFNVAAQGGTWAFFINYGQEVMHFSKDTAGEYMMLFMAMMALGRIVGTALMRVIAPNKLLAAFAMGSIVSCILAAQGLGWASYIALLMINFFFSIMFPTIFSLGLKNLGAHTQQASSFISMGVVGGAFFPFVMGLIANHNVASAYYLPIICYAVIFMFGYKLYKVKG
ncbi:L-fucose:H+ symporter permease [Mucilaginibacter sp. L3T2-6]|uniref:L-fucose:H+ symporter permease n=1 Tax=Mucilaginibacter sp. L3T2-6 TaxID=3062491 RepID=UPI002674A1B1|nr:L-fucose:H+ symporter permease [Mucilaginibacter sp. L3T2-6]MDO3642023.1 L-fucose:H+ symporter permease [Mucilaginibacter sp. L3T2-6]MDV6214299.1 L-fucose:H+ symporter permease [Mucilaginibacter sp. L3T2-6]